MLQVCRVQGGATLGVLKVEREAPGWRRQRWGKGAGVRIRQGFNLTLDSENVIVMC